MNVNVDNGNNSLRVFDDFASHYQQFRVSERILLTGHSHQAWPDVAFDGQQQAWKDAAEWVDDKWGRAFEKADKVKAFFAERLGDSSGEHYTLASNTHDLLIRFLSSLDWKRGRKIITTDGEFHSMRRQLARLSEEGVEVVSVPVAPTSTLTERMRAEVTDDTVAIMMSAVMFKDAAIIPHLDIIADAANSRDIPLLVDTYHAINVIPFNLQNQKLDQAYVVGGGYKYCQFGEGNCFMRIPEHCRSRPIITGWYAEFGELEKTSDPTITQYPKGGARFQGSTYDTTSHYRAAAVIDFFSAQKLDVGLLRAKSQQQVGLLRDAFDALALDSRLISRADVPLEQIAGFLSLKTRDAQGMQQALMARGILTDQRDGYLRLGPAPYMTDRQLTDAIETLGEVVTALR